MKINQSLRTVGQPNCIVIADTGFENQTSFSYDGAGLRVRKQFQDMGGTRKVTYIYSGTQVLAEYNTFTLGSESPTTTLTEYIYVGSQKLASIVGGTTKYHLNDHLSARVTTDSSGGNAVEQAQYPFGEDWYAGSGASKFKFTTYERDTAQSDYAVFRNYQFLNGRFNRPDPIGGSILDPQSLNRFAYVLNDPINLVDPFGLDGTCSGGKCVVIVDTTPYPGGGGKITVVVYGAASYPGGGVGNYVPKMFKSRFTFGVRGSGQSWWQCMQQHASNYSIAGLIDGVQNRNGDTEGFQFTEDFLTSTLLGNNITGAVFLVFGSDGQSLNNGATTAASVTPGLVAKGMGTNLTAGKRTASIIAMNLEGTTGTAAQVLARSPLLRQGLSFLAKLGPLGLAIDSGFVLAEALGCAIPQ